MTLEDINQVTHILNRYYISSDLRATVAYSYETDKKMAIVYGIFPDSFDSKLNKSKYGITKYGHYYLVSTGEAILYILHEYRNYLFVKSGLPTIDALKYMINEYQHYLSNKVKLNITNEEWMARIGNSNYFENKKKTSKKLQILLKEFDASVKLNNETSDYDLIKGNKENCILQIKDQNVTKRYSRNKNGFCYTIFGNIDEKQIDVSHCFKNNEETIKAIINKVEIEYNLNNNILKVNGVILESNEQNMYLIYQILTDIIKEYNIELYKQIKILK